MKIILGDSYANRVTKEKQKLVDNTNAYALLRWTYQQTINEIEISFNSEMKYDRISSTLIEFFIDINSNL